MPNENGTARFPLDAATLQRLDNLALITRNTLATSLAAALAYVALKCEDNVIIGALTDRLTAHRRTGSGKHAIWAAGEFLSSLPHGGSTDLNRDLYDLGRVVTGPGLTIVISDFLVPGGYQAGLRAVRQ